MTILRCRVCILGDSTVGKTAVAALFQGKPYPKNYILTAGAEFGMKAVKIPDTDNTVELYTFDVSGHELYKSVRGKYMEGASFVVICYDMANRDSFANCKKWIEEFKSHNSGRKIQGLIVATKSDLKEFAVVKSEVGADFASENGFGFFECSAASGKDVDTPFNFLANLFHMTYEKKAKELSGAAVASAAASKS